MALKVINKINSRLQFLYRINRYLLPHLKTFLCNAIIQPHFNYVCSAWYPNLNKKFKNKLQIIQNKCIRIYLQLDSRSHTGIKEFEQINWLPVSKRYNQCICSNAFKLFNENCPLYLYGLYKPSGQDQDLILKLNHLCRSACSGQNSLSYLTPTISNNLHTCLKLSNSLNSFKHGIKEYFLKKLKNKEQDIFAY